MNDRHRRFMLLLVALALGASHMVKGRAVSRTGDVAAFLPSGSERAGMLTIGIRGDVTGEGVYQVSSRAELETVMKMTLPAFSSNFRGKPAVPAELISGDLVNIVPGKMEYAEITVEKMSVTERITLGIPLDPNSLSASDWERIPGIGPVTAKSIVNDRQKNGDFFSPEELMRVPGIGEARFRHLQRYFNYASIY